VIRVVEDGRSRSGARREDGPVANEFGTIVRRRATYRFINVEVLLTNRGPKPFRGTLSGTITTSDGKFTLNSVPHTGRAPDWTDGESHGIAPGKGALRWLTVPMLTTQKPGYVELTPEVEYKTGTVIAVEPMQARWLVG
jgi:hypothetical protein